MLKFLFRGREKEVVVETQRQNFERIISELNSAIDGLPVKPRVTLDPVTGHVELHLPEQMPDEALALPAPTGGINDEKQETPDAVTDAVKGEVA
ncbi:hypothetical protein BCF46_1145 [Litoreibacter meonggei]|uniref:Uncharacterized protein n=1 Tax=Litoreibacter meonggei TaxID=1049199 RepID=A0A497X3E2_9RHOB|nr:hypothetical protein [Litoreibacter meonggei]RLJ59003.1 hypothetical protein BCF46_1145 [Litoreibacter meonggei]